MGFFGRTSKRSGRVRLGALAMAAAIALACHYFDEDDSGSSFMGTSQFEGPWKGTLVEPIIAPTYAEPGEQVPRRRRQKGHGVVVAQDGLEGVAGHVNEIEAPR